MPNDRRDFVPGGTDVFTLKTERNAPLFRVEPNVRFLGEVIREIKPAWPVTIDAMARVPDVGE